MIESNFFSLGGETYLQAPDRQKLTLLLIDDCEDDRRNVRIALSKDTSRPYYFVEAHTLSEAFSILSSRSDIDLIILDDDLPDGSPTDFLEKFTNTSQAPPLPVVVVSGDAWPDVPGLIGAGAQSYIGKAWLCSESLSRSIDTALERFSLFKVIAESNRRLSLTMEKSGTGFWEYSSDVQEFNVSNEILKVLGLDKSPVSLAKFLKTMPHEFAHQWQAKISSTLIHDTPLECEFKTLQDDVECWNYCRGSLAADGKILGLWQEITLRKEAELALSESEAFSRSLMESSQDSITVIDLEGKVSQMNRPGMRAMDIDDFATVLGKNWESLWQGDQQENIHRALNAAKLGTSSRFQLNSPTFRGNLKWWDMFVSPVRDLAGNVNAVLSTTRDISELKAAEEEATRELEVRRAAESALRESEQRYRELAEELEVRVEQRTESLQKAVDELNGFTYSVSHDMRSPLRAIIATCMIMIEDFGDALPEEAKSELLRQAASARKLGNLVDDLLRYARLGRQELQHRRVDLSSLAETVVKGLHQPGEVGCEAEYYVEQGMEIQGDGSLIEILLTILFDNAGKYRSRLRPCKVNFYHQVRDGEVQYVVEDNGIGFDMAFYNKLFEPFQRLHRDEAYPGTGIGLANARRIVERHSGTIWAESKGEGAKFFFTLPSPNAPSDSQSDVLSELPSEIRGLKNASSLL